MNYENCLKMNLIGIAVNYYICIFSGALIIYLMSIFVRGNNMKNGRSLKPMQLTAIQLLAVGTPASHVAERLEVSAMTIYRWQKLPAFEAKLRSITDSGLEEIAKKMNAATLTAIETLQEVLCDLREPVGTRIKVSLGLLSVMASVNAALERSLQSRAGDFDLSQRWNGPAVTFDSSGNRIQG